MKRQYKIISAASTRIGTLSELITAALNEGWEIAGPLVVSAGENEDWLYQPLIKSDKEI